MKVSSSALPTAAIVVEGTAPEQPAVIGSPILRFPLAIKLVIHLVMTADVEQDNLFFGNEQGQGNAVTVGKADGMASGKFAGERMERQAGLKRILL